MQLDKFSNARLFSLKMRINRKYFVKKLTVHQLPSHDVHGLGNHNTRLTSLVTTALSL